MNLGILLPSARHNCYVFESFLFRDAYVMCLMHMCTTSISSAAPSSEAHNDGPSMFFGESRPLLTLFVTIHELARRTWLVGPNKTTFPPILSTIYRYFHRRCAFVRRIIS
jgi:hypothetical protein